MEHQLEKAVEAGDVEDLEDLEDLEGSTETQEIQEGKGSKDSDVRNSLNEDGTLPANALDLRLFFFYLKHLLGSSLFQQLESYQSFFLKCFIRSGGRL